MLIISHILGHARHTRNNYCVMFDVIYVCISTGIKTQRDVLQELRFSKSS